MAGARFDTARRLLAESKKALCPPTHPHVEGPFFRPGAPELLDLFPKDSNGIPLHFLGEVVSDDCSPIPHCLVELWHADDLGRYDNDDPNHPPDPTVFRCRSAFSTNGQGRFSIRTVLPGNYAVDDELGAWMRVKHLHFKMHAEGRASLTTEIALLPDPYTTTDLLYDPALSTDLSGTLDSDGRPAKAARFRFVLMQAGKRAYVANLAGIVGRLGENLGT